MKKFLLFFLTMSLVVISNQSQQPQASTGLGNAASQMMESLSPDLLLEELYNSPFLSDEEKLQLNQMSEEEKSQLFSSMVDIFNDPQFQAALNDPKFLEEIEKANELINSGSYEDYLNEFEEPEPEPIKQPTPKPAPPAAIKPPIKTPPSQKECASIQQVLKKLLQSMYTLETKIPHYPLIHQFYKAYLPQLSEFKYYLEIMQKDDILKQLASDEYAMLTRSICTMQEKLSRLETELPQEPYTPTEIYNPYAILGIHTTATNDEIKDRFSYLSNQKGPAQVKKHLVERGLSGQELAKKVKKAELNFAPIQQAYNDLIDAEYRKEITRLLQAEETQEENIVKMTRQTAWNIISTLEEALITPGAVLSNMTKLVETYAANALEAKGVRLKADQEMAKKIDELARKSPRLSPVPYQPVEFVYPHYPQHMPGRYEPGYQPSREGYTPSYRDGAVATGPNATKPGAQEKDKDKEKKNEGKKEEKDKKEAPGKGGVPGKKETKKKPEELPDIVIIALKAFDDMLTTIERGKEFIKEEEKEESDPEKKKKKEEESLKKDKTDIEKGKNELLQNIEEMIGIFKASDAGITVDELTTKIKNIATKLRLPELSLKEKDVRLKIQRSEAAQILEKLPNDKRKEILDGRKSLFNDILKKHKDLISAFQNIHNLKVTDVKEDVFRSTFFKNESTDAQGKTQTKMPKNLKLVEMQNTLDKMISSIDEIMKKLDPEGAQKKVSAQQAQ